MIRLTSQKKVQRRNLGLQKMELQWRFPGPLEVTRAQTWKKLAISRSNLRHQRSPSQREHASIRRSCRMELALRPCLRSWASGFASWILCVHCFAKFSKVGHPPGLWSLATRAPASPQFWSNLPTCPSSQEKTHFALAYRLIYAYDVTLRPAKQSCQSTRFSQIEVKWKKEWGLFGNQQVHCSKSHLREVCLGKRSTGDDRFSVFSLQILQVKWLLRLLTCLISLLKTGKW